MEILLGAWLTGIISGFVAYSLTVIWFESELFKLFREKLQEATKLRYVKNPTEINRVLATGLSCFVCTSFWFTTATAVVMTAVFGILSPGSAVVAALSGFVAVKLLRRYLESQP